MRTYRILSLGAGVQSTTIALMVHKGELPPIDAAIFADPQEEGESTYAHLKWLMDETIGSFQTYTATAGRLGDDLRWGKGGNGGRFASIPAFQSETVGGENTGIGRRQCTKEYKTEVVERAIRRVILKLEPRQRIPKDVSVVQIIGLSADEPSRVLRVRTTFSNSVKWAVPEFPLFDLGMDRAACIQWLKDYGVPHEVPRSACVFCPYKSNSEWLRLKESDQRGWERAVDIDRALRTPGNVVNRKMERLMFLHRSCVPLEEADLRDRDRRIGQTIMSFDTECLGMCGN